MTQMMIAREVVRVGDGKPCPRHRKNSLLICNSLVMIVVVVVLVLVEVVVLVVV